MTEPRHRTASGRAGRVARVEEALRFAYAQPRSEGPPVQAGAVLARIRARAAEGPDVARDPFVRRFVPLAGAVAMALLAVYLWPGLLDGQNAGTDTAADLQALQDPLRLWLEQVTLP